MPELTDPDNDGILEFTQTVEDVDGDSLSITGELDQINGTTQSGSDRNPSWFSFTTSSSLSGGTRTVDVNIQINASELGGAGTTYTFELYADDGVSTSTCTFTLEVTSSSPNTLLISYNDNEFQTYDIKNGTFNTVIPSAPGANDYIVAFAKDSANERVWFALKVDGVDKVEYYTAPFSDLSNWTKQFEDTTSSLDIRELHYDNEKDRLPASDNQTDETIYYDTNGNRNVVRGFTVFPLAFDEKRGVFGSEDDIYEIRHYDYGNNVKDADTSAISTGAAFYHPVLDEFVYYEGNNNTISRYDPNDSYNKTDVNNSFQLGNAGIHAPNEGPDAAAWTADESSNGELVVIDLSDGSTIRDTGDVPTAAPDDYLLINK
jgi:hypothetical protein